MDDDFHEAMEALQDLKIASEDAIQGAEFLLEQEAQKLNIGQKRKDWTLAKLKETAVDLQRLTAILEKRWQK